MSKQWKYTAVGFCIGICVMLIFNFFTNNKEENRTVDLQEEVNNLEDEYIENAKNENAEMEYSEARETEHEELESSGIRISDNVKVSQGFVEELLLYQYIEYGIRKYNENSGNEKRYYVDLKDMLPYNTEFCMKNDDSEPFKTDLAKEIIPELSNNLYNFELIGEDGSIYMQIDTYNMKIYVYDDAKISQGMQDWQIAYAEYIEGVEYAHYNKYALIYVDEDDIPELVIYTGTYATACLILTFHNGEVDALQTGSLQCNYIEKKNLLLDAGGQMGEYFDHIYSIENGKWVYVTGGGYIAKFDENGWIPDEYDYMWEGEAVSEDIYFENLEAVWNWEQNQNIRMEQYDTLEEMLLRLF